jgi:WD40 repeat protein
VRRELAPGLQPFIAALSADERTMACIDARGLLVFAEVASGQTTPPVNSEHGYPYWLALSPDGRQAATSGSNLSVCLWDIAARRCKATWTMTDQIANGAFSPDGRKLALVHKTGSLEIRDLQAAPGQERPITLVTSSGLLEGVAFHPSEPRLFVSGRDGFVHVFDTNRWEEVAQLRSDPAGQRTGKISRLAMPASGAWLAGFAESGVIRFWRR